MAAVYLAAEADLKVQDGTVSFVGIA